MENAYAEKKRIIEEKIEKASRMSYDLLNELAVLEWNETKIKKPTCDNLIQKPMKGRFKYKGKSQKEETADVKKIKEKLIERESKEQECIMIFNTTRFYNTIANKKTVNPLLDLIELDMLKDNSREIKNVVKSI